MHEGGTASAAFTPQEISLVQAQSTPGPWCGHRESKPRPFGLQRRGSTNCTTACRSVEGTITEFVFKVVAENLGWKQMYPTSSNNTLMFLVSIASQWAVYYSMSKGIPISRSCRFAYDHCPHRTMHRIDMQDDSYVTPGSCPLSPRFRRPPSPMN